MDETLQVQQKCEHQGNIEVFLGLKVTPRQTLLPPDRHIDIEPKNLVVAFDPKEGSVTVRDADMKEEVNRFRFIGAMGDAGQTNQNGQDVRVSLLGTRLPPNKELDAACLGQLLQTALSVSREALDKRFENAAVTDRGAQGHPLRPATGVGQVAHPKEPVVSSGAGAPGGH